MEMESDKEINKIDYSVNAAAIGKMGGIFGAIFLLTFIINFPVLKLTKEKIRTVLSSNNACPISFDKMDISFFLPAVELDHVNISRACLRKNIDLVMDKVETKVIGPSFSPFGVATQTNFDFLGNHLEVLFSQGIGSSLVKLNDQNIKLNTLKDLFEFANLRGNLNINSLVKLDNFKVKSGNVFLKSKDLSIGSMNISGFNTPSLDIKALSLKGVINKGILNISELIVGDAKSPVRAKFKGAIKINERNPALSNVDLKGEVKFSEDLKEKLFFLDQFLKSYNKKDNFYLIQIKGTLSYALPSTY